MKKLTVITERTDREWPADHPLRQVSSVIMDARIPRAHFLICSYDWEERIPPAPGDEDVECECSRCPAKLVRRASAPDLPPICRGCWGMLA